MNSLNFTKTEDSQKWEAILEFLSDRFNIPKEELNIEVVLFHVGLQVLGKPIAKFNKNQKMDLLHIAVCRVLEPYGYYKFLGVDEDGWPHFENIEPLPELKSGEQTILMKQAVIRFFEDEKIL